MTTTLGTNAVVVTRVHYNKKKVDVYNICRIYSIQSNYCTYPYKRIVKKFRSLQMAVSIPFVYFFIKAYVVGTHLNCIDLSMQFK